MSVSYEWDIETVDEHGDIQDHDFFDKLKNCFFNLNQINEKTIELVLVRDEYNQCGQHSRTWAYMKKKKIPEFFTDAYNCESTKVPQKYIIEFNRWVDKQ